jgi:hypothetical protein
MRNIPNYEEIQKHDLVAGLELMFALLLFLGEHFPERHSGW